MSGAAFARERRPSETNLPTAHELCRNLSGGPNGSRLLLGPCVFAMPEFGTDAGRTEACDRREPSLPELERGPCRRGQKMECSVRPQGYGFAFQGKPAEHAMMSAGERFVILSWDAA